MGAGRVLEFCLLIHGRVCMCGGQRTTLCLVPRCLSAHIDLLLLKTKSLFDLELLSRLRLAGLGALDLPACLHFTNAVMKAFPTDGSRCRNTELNIRQSSGNPI